MFGKESIFRLSRPGKITVGHRVRAFERRTVSTSVFIEQIVYNDSFDGLPITIHHLDIEQREFKSIS
jgi:hypothetical protein